MDVDAWWIDTNDGCVHPRQAYRGTKLPCATPGCSHGVDPKASRLTQPCIGTGSGFGMIELERRRIKVLDWTKPMWMWHDGRKDEKTMSSNLITNKTADGIKLIADDNARLLEERTDLQRKYDDMLKRAQDANDAVREYRTEAEKWERQAHETQNKLDNAEARLRDLERRANPTVSVTSPDSPMVAHFNVVEAGQFIEKQRDQISKLYEALDQISREVTFGFAASRVAPLQIVVDNIIDKIRLHRRADIRIRNGRSAPRFVEGYVTDIEVSFPTMPRHDDCGREYRVRTHGSTMTARVRVCNVPPFGEYVQIVTEDEKEMELIKQKFDSRERITVELT